VNRTLLVCLCVSFSLCFAALFAIPVLAAVQISSTSIGFGSVSVNSSSAPATLVITNTGRHSVTLEQISSSASQFVVSGITLPLTLGPYASARFSIVFQPTAAQSFSGTVKISFTGRGGSGFDNVSVTGSGIQPLITLTPGSAVFGSVTAGVTNTQTFIISNPGTANLSITQVSLSGTAFAYSGLVLPLTIAPGASAAFTVSFAPTSATPFSGTLTVANNSPTPILTVPLIGTGVASALQLSAVPTSLEFGEVATGSNFTLTASLTNTGNANVSLNSEKVTGTGFSIAD
jgi:Cep192 domain 4